LPLLNRFCKGRSTCAKASGAILLAQPAHLAIAVSLICSRVKTCSFCDGVTLELCCGTNGPIVKSDVLHETSPRQQKPPNFTVLYRHTQPR
jgi:hypothetical protein